MQRQMAFNLKWAAHLCSSAHGPEFHRPEEREKKSQASYFFLLLLSFLSVWQRIWAPVCLSVSLSGWMSQLTERSSITQESDGAELSLTDGEMKSEGWRERWRESTERDPNLYKLFGIFIPPHHPLLVVWGILPKVTMSSGMPC